MSQPSKYEAILFDLDGTLVDTAPDLIESLRITAKVFDYPVCDEGLLRPQASNGAKGLITAGLEILDTHKDYYEIERYFLDTYMSNSTKKSRLFDGFEDLLARLESKHIPWGIVTNKPHYLTMPILEKLKLKDRSKVTICGDTLTKNKPHPLPLLTACELISKDPKKTLYVGDAERDIEAGNNAGMDTVVALFGYISSLAVARSWGADYEINSPSELECLINL